MTKEDKIMEEYNATVEDGNITSISNGHLSWINFGGGTEDLPALSKIISKYN